MSEQVKFNIKHHFTTIPIRERLAKKREATRRFVTELNQREQRRGNRDDHGDPGFEGGEGA